jgi:hypothetical protein
VYPSMCFRSVVTSNPYIFLISGWNFDLMHVYTLGSSERLSTLAVNCSSIVVLPPSQIILSFDFLIHKL